METIKLYIVKDINAQNFIQEAHKTFQCSTLSSNVNTARIPNENKLTKTFKI